MEKISINGLLQELNQVKGAIFLGITTKTLKMPGESGFTKFKRGDKTVPNPFVNGVCHLMYQTVLIKADYERMVNNQRGRELEQYKYNLPTPPKFLKNPPPEPEAEVFIAEELWNGKGLRDERYPRFVVYHVETLQRYMCYRPSSTAEDGSPTPITSEYTDAMTGSVLTYENDLKDFMPAKSKPKSQMTEKMIPWQVVKLENIVSVKFRGEVFEIV